MTASDRLCRLHLRLTLDHQSAFTSNGGGANVLVHHTRAGLSWLHDYHAYRKLWRQLERSDLAPGTILKHEFGYVLEHEIPPDLESTVCQESSLG